MDQPAKGAHGSLHAGCSTAARFPSESLGGSCPKQKEVLETDLFKVDVLKTVLHIHHPQRAVLGCSPQREGSAELLDPQQVPGKSNPEGTWINKIIFVSANIIQLSSWSPSNILIPFQLSAVSLTASVYCFPCFFCSFFSSLHFFPHFFFEEQHPLPSHSLFPMVSWHVLPLFCIILSIF